MPKFYDLGEKPAEPVEVDSKEPKIYYPSLNITTKQVLELGDYELGDVVDFHIKCVVVGERKTEDQPKSMDLEMRKAAILNPTKLRQEAEELGLPMAEMRDLDSHRKSLKKKEKE